MKEITAGQLQRDCLEILDGLDDDGVVVMKDGRPVARLVPIRPDSDADLIGSLRGALDIKGDIMSTGIRWEAES